MSSLACEVILHIGEEGSSLQDQGQANGAYETLTIFECLHRASHARTFVKF